MHYPSHYAFSSSLGINMLWRVLSVYILVLHPSRCRARGP